MKKIVPVAIALFIKDVDSSGFKTWMQIRRDDGELNGKWEFPGGKIEANELPVDAVKREVQEEVEFSINDLTQIKLFRLYPYSYGDKTVCLFPFVIEGAKPPLAKGEWFQVNYDTKSAPLVDKIPAANIPLIDELCVYLKNLNDTGTYQYLWK